MASLGPYELTFELPWHLMRFLSEISIHHIFCYKKAKNTPLLLILLHCRALRQQFIMLWAIMIKFRSCWCMSQHLKSVKPICDMKMKRLQIWLFFQRMYIHYLMKVPCGAVITRSVFSQTFKKNRPLHLSFVDLASGWYSASIPVIIHVISYNIYWTALWRHSNVIANYQW